MGILQNEYQTNIYETQTEEEHKIVSPYYSNSKHSHMYMQIFKHKFA